MQARTLQDLPASLLGSIVSQAAPVTLWSCFLAGLLVSRSLSFLCCGSRSFD